MNIEHLRTFMWLRWRLAMNQWRRSGALNAALMMIVVVALVALAIPFFVGSFLGGVFLFPKATPSQLMYTWDAVVGGFALFWLVGLITEVQRSEPLAITNFLHLPVSVQGAFVINYVSSLVRVSVILFVPMMLGFALALPIAVGLQAIIVLPLTVAFLLMVTALSYQFQGWLASLMSNPRRRRTVIVVTTTVFILIFQLPNMLQFMVRRSPAKMNEQTAKHIEELNEITRELQEHKIDAAEHQRRLAETSERYSQALAESHQQSVAKIERTVWLVNAAVPVGWLPLGVDYLARGNLWPALLGTLAMGGVGTFCLWRAYRTTLGLYQGRFTGGGTPQPAPTAPVAKTGPRKTLLVEAQLPGVSEPVSAVALAGFRSLARSPESKMMMLTPVILSAIFGSLALQSGGAAHEALRALFGVGAISVALFGTLQLTANQFGFDRDGFRTYVLCGARRRDILVGKNLAFSPLALGMAILLLLILQVLCPMRWDHFLAMAPQAVAMYLLVCLMANLMSIYTPLQIPAGSMKPKSVKLIPALLQMAMMMFLPVLVAPTLFPLGIETALASQGIIDRAPVCLALTAVMCAAVVFVYVRVIAWQGDLLRSREQAILNTVTSREA